MRWERFFKNCAFAVILFLLVNLLQVARLPGSDVVREYIAFAFTSDWDYRPALGKAQEGIRTLATYAGRFSSWETEGASRESGGPGGRALPAAPAPAATAGLAPNRSSDGGAPLPAPAAPPAQEGAAPLPSSAGPRLHLWPADGRVSERYGRREHPVYRLAGPHEGIDIAAQSGAPVMAAAPGKVARTFRSLSSGLTVDVAHDGFLTRYAHLSAIKVRVGESVPAGHTIGLVGSTGVSTGPHLHFEVRVKDQPVDPLPLLPR